VILPWGLILPVLSLSIAGQTATGSSDTAFESTGTVSGVGINRIRRKGSMCSRLRTCSSLGMSDKSWNCRCVSDQGSEIRLRYKHHSGVDLLSSRRELRSMMRWPGQTTFVGTTRNGWWLLQNNDSFHLGREDVV